MNAQDHYSRRLATLTAEAQVLNARDTRVANLRVAPFVMAAVLPMIWGFSPPVVLGMGACALVFVGLVIVHNRILAQARDNRARSQFNTEGLQRIKLTPTPHDKWRAHISQPDAQHPFANHLGVFDPRGLFDRLSIVGTPLGAQRLAAWLAPTSPPTRAQLRDRQEALRSLRGRTTLREDFHALSEKLLGHQANTEGFAAWLRNAPKQAPKTALLQGGLLALSLSFVCMAVLWWLQRIPDGVFFGVIALGIVSHRLATITMLQWVGDLDSRESDATLLRALTARMSHEPPGDAALIRQALTTLGTHTHGAHHSLAKLVRLLRWFDAPRNLLFAPISAITFWRIHLGAAIMRFRVTHQQTGLQWLDALGELDALLAGSLFCFEREDISFPQIIDTETPQLKLLGARHPFLPDAIPNDVALGESTTLLIVSGSNMSGKSTLLRSIASNVVLGFAGFPVRATEASLSRFSLVTSISAQDSLEDGVSRFQAELQRVRLTLESARNEPTIFLFDELFAGTNSHDRLEGAQALLRALLTYNAAGVITTHDLALTEIAREKPSVIRNVHFADTFKDGELIFDYTLHDGVVEHSNALQLMRSIGVPV